jgi:plasmid replication initiation protein
MRRQDNLFGLLSCVPLTSEKSQLPVDEEYIVLLKDPTEMAKTSKAVQQLIPLFNDRDFQEADRQAKDRVIQQDRLVAQHNDLIRARYEMSLLEARLFVSLLGRVNRGDKEFVLCRIPVSELYPGEKVGGKAYVQVKEAVMRLVSRIINLETTDERGLREIISNPLMATCRYKEGSGYVIAQFNNFVKPYLLELQGNFTVAELQTLLSFRSFYSHRLYWLLKSGAFHQDDVKLNLTTLKQTLNLESRYQNYADFKRYVLDVAQKELAKTDMAFDYQPLKEGRAVSTILFQLLRPTLIAHDEVTLPEGIQQTLTEIGLTLKSLTDIKTRFQQDKLSEEYLRFVIQYYQDAKTKGRIKSLAGALYKALMTDQLLSEYQSWKDNQPTYSTPKPVQKKTSKVDIISVDELREGFAVLKRKGLTEFNTFEESLDSMLQQEAYELDIIDGREVLVYTEA